MPLTHDFKETIRARARRDRDFRQALLREAVERILNGDLETGKAVLRNYVNATAGFQDLEKRTRIPAKSLMRMLGPRQPVRRQLCQHPNRLEEHRRRSIRAFAEAVSHHLTARSGSRRRPVS